MLEDERRLTLQAKWEIKKQQQATGGSLSVAPPPGGAGVGQQVLAPRTPNKPTFAFGSCTPRLLDNHVDGFLWKSQYNLNVMKEPGIRASSAHDLHLQQSTGESNRSNSKSKIDIDVLTILVENVVFKEKPVLFELFEQKSYSQSLLVLHTRLNR